MSFAGHSSYRAYIQAVESALDSTKNEIQNYLAAKTSITDGAFHGPTGAIGATGPSSVGATGATGATGPRGNTGPTGYAGTAVNGAIGTTGATGASGVVGQTGPVGATGPSGGIGATGATGAMGATGPNGLTLTGFTGPAGATGAIASSISFSSSSFPQLYFSSTVAYDYEVRYRTSAGSGANLWVNYYTFYPHTWMYYRLVANLKEANFNATEALLCANTNSTSFVASNSKLSNISVSDTTGLFTLTYPAVPTLVQMRFMLRNTSSPLSFTLRLRGGSLTGTILAQTTMVQNANVQGMAMCCAAIVQNVAVLAPTLQCSGLFSELFDVSTCSSLQISITSL